MTRVHRYAPPTHTATVGRPELWTYTQPSSGSARRISDAPAGELGGRQAWSSSAAIEGVQHDRADRLTAGCGGEDPSLRGGDERDGLRLRGGWRSGRHVRGRREPYCR